MSSRSGLGDPDFATPPHIVAAAKEAMADGRCDHYTHPAGLIELRRAIAAKLARDNGIIADPETEITVTTGGQEGLYAIVQALLDPGDEILVPDPRYSSYDAAIGRAGGVIVPVPTRQEDDFDLRPEEVARRITPRTKAILLVTPGNPTAAVISPAHLRAIADLAIAHDLVVIADEIYEKFVFDGAEHFSIGSLPAMRERTITLSGFSKTYAMTGWRLGYVGRPRRADAGDPRPQAVDQHHRARDLPVGGRRRAQRPAGVRRSLPRHLRRAPPRPDARARRVGIHLRPPVRHVLSSSRTSPRPGCPPSPSPANCSKRRTS